MTDIEFARKQHEIFQTSSNRDEMFEKLDKLNKQYLAESVPYNKTLESERE